MMRRYGLPMLPAIIGVILGPFAEEQLRQALQISNGKLSGLIDPVSIVVFVIVALMLLWPLVRRLLPRKVGRSRCSPRRRTRSRRPTSTPGSPVAVSVERHVGGRRSRPDAGRETSRLLAS